MSNHDFEKLERFAAGTLGGAEKEEILRHVAECDDCRSWLDTHRLIAEALASENAGALHPFSEQLARYAVDPESLTAPERERFEDHVRGCVQCREQLSLTGQALAQARGSETEARHLLPATLTPVRLALAASLLLMLGLGWVLQRTPGAGSQTAKENLALSGESLHGAQLIETDGSLTAESVTVASDGDITLRAGALITFGEGFAVGEGGTLRVEIGTSSNDRDSDTT